MTQQKYIYIHNTKLTLISLSEWKINWWDLLEPPSKFDKFQKYSYGIFGEKYLSCFFFIFHRLFLFWKIFVSECLWLLLTVDWKHFSSLVVYVWSLGLYGGFWSIFVAVEEEVCAKAYGLAIYMGHTDHQFVCPYGLSICMGIQILFL